MVFHYEWVLGGIGKVMMRDVLSWMLEGADGGKTTSTTIPKKDRQTMRSENFPERQSLCHTSRESVDWIDPQSGRGVTMLFVAQWPWSNDTRCDFTI